MGTKKVVAGLVAVLLFTGAGWFVWMAVSDPSLPRDAPPGFEEVGEPEVAGDRAPVLQTRQVELVVRVREAVTLEPVRGTTVRVVAADGNEHTSEPARTNEEGVVTFAVGEHTTGAITVAHDGYPSVRMSFENLGANGERQAVLDVVVGGAASLNGRVGGPADMDLTSVAIRLSSAESGRFIDVLSEPNSTGEFQVQKLAPGTYRVSAHTLWSGAAWTAETDLLIQEGTRVDLTLRRRSRQGSGHVSGTAVLSEQDLFKRWFVYWQTESPVKSGRVPVQHDGTFRIEVPSRFGTCRLNLRPADALGPWRRDDGHRTQRISSGVRLEPDELDGFRIQIEELESDERVPLQVVASNRPDAPGQRLHSTGGGEPSEILGLKPGEHYLIYAGPTSDGRSGWSSGMVSKDALVTITLALRKPSPIWLRLTAPSGCSLRSAVVIIDGAQFRFERDVDTTNMVFSVDGLHEGIQWWARAEGALASGERVHSRRVPVDLDRKESTELKLLQR